MPTPPLSIYYIGGQNGKGPGWSYTDTMHTYDRHDDITQLKQPEATIINVN